MKLIKTSFEIIEPTGYTLDDIYKSIELAGKVSHKSEHTIKENSAKEFVDRMIKLGHGATLEFGTVYLKIPAGKYSFLCDYFDDCNDIKDSFFSNPYTKIHCQDGYFYISTNYRVLIETFSQEFISELLQYLCKPTEHHEKRICVKFILDRGILAEFTRHRKFSFMAESTRYCNYSIDKFGNELTFIIPCWCDDIPDNLQLNDNIEVDRFVWGTDNLAKATIENKIVKRKVSKFTQSFLYEMIGVETTYIGLIASGYKPQEARALLPNALKTELYMCGFVSDWKKFLELRCASNAHPQARELALPLHQEFLKRNYIYE